MNPLVPIKVGSLNKTLLTDGALIGLLPRVDFLVVAQPREVAKALPTRITLAGLLARVDSLMLHEV